jgi:putative ABC transport system substrate-binding protein
MLLKKSAADAVYATIESRRSAIRIKVASMNRPGGNITGAVFFTNLLASKQLELLHQIVPDAHVIGVLTNPNNTTAEVQLDETKAAAQTLGLQLVVQHVGTNAEIDTAFADLARQQISTLFMNADAFFASRASQIAQLAARHKIAVSFSRRGFAEAGGLMSYAPSIADSYRQAGVYVARVLKGEKPSDLPIQQSTKFEFVLNLKTAGALGITIPETLLATADEVIQ